MDASTGGHATGRARRCRRRSHGYERVILSCSHSHVLESHRVGVTRVLAGTTQQHLPRESIWARSDTEAKAKSNDFMRHAPDKQRSEPLHRLL